MKYIVSDGDSRSQTLPSKFVVIQRNDKLLSVGMSHWSKETMGGFPLPTFLHFPSCL